MKKRAAIVWLVVLVIAGSGVAALDVERVEKGNLIIEGIPEIPEEVMERLRQYQNTRSASLQGWHPSGRGIFISTRFAETTQIHWVGQPGGARRQITFFKEPVGSAQISPNAEVNGFLFGKDVGGSEFYQIFFFDLATGEWRMMTDGESRNGGATWAHDGKRFVFYTTQRNGKDWDIHLGRFDRPGTTTPVLEKEGTWFPLEFSPDDSKLLILRYISANENYLHILDLESKKLTSVDTGEEKVSFSSAAFSPDGKGLYFSNDRKSEFKRLQYHDLVTGKTEVLTDEIPWDVEGFEVADKGKHLAFTVNENGISRLHVRSLPGGNEMTLPDLPAGQVYGLEFSPDGKRMGLVINSSQTPGDVFSFELGSTELARWTRSEVGGMDTGEFATPRLVHYETFDAVNGKARKIPAFYYRPKGDGPHPVVISIHGGPEGQARPYFSSTIQYWVNELGVAVLQPNVRGSAGYGKSYLKLDNGFAREDSVKDIGKLLDWIDTRSELDNDRIAVYGGSYGGYMVLASMVHYSDRLKAGVDVVGISNFVTFLKNTQDYRRDLRRVEYGDERIPEMNSFLERISPNNQADKITKPLFIVQGKNDPRVPVTESEQMVEKIRQGGGAVWYLMAQDEGHGFRKKANRDYYEASASLFLERHLLQPPALAETR